MNIQAALLCVCFVLYAATSVTAQNTQQNKRAKAESVLQEGVALAEEETPEKLRAAFMKFSEARDIARSINYKEIEGTALAGMGKVSKMLGDNAKAIEYYTQSLPLIKTVEEKIIPAVALMELASIYSESGDNQKALEFYLQAVPFLKESGEKEYEALALNEIGTIYRKLGQQTKAIEFLNLALSLVKTMPEEESREKEAEILTMIAGIYEFIGDIQKSIEHFNQALSILRKIENKEGEASVLAEIGFVYAASVDFQKALEYLNQALKLSKQINSKSVESRVLKNLGFVYTSIGENKKALEYLNQALQILKQEGAIEEQAHVFNYMGDVYLDLGEDQKALEYFNQALSLMKEYKNDQGVAAILSKIASVYFYRDENKKGIDYLEQSLQISKKNGYKVDEATSMIAIDAIYLDSGENQKALDYFNKTISLTKEIGVKHYEAINLSGLMLVWKALKSPRMAVFYGKQAVNILQRLREKNKGLDKDLQKQILDIVKPVYRELADILIESGRLLEAEQVLTLLKEEEFSTLRRRADEGSEIGYTPKEKAALDVLNKLAEYGRELVDLYKLKENKTLDEKGKERIAYIERELIPVANTRYKEALDEIAKAPKTEEKTAEVKEAQALQKSIGELGNGTVALYTVVSTEECKSTKGWVILVTPKFRKAYTVDVKDLEKTVFAFRHALSSPIYDPVPLAQKLYRAIFQNPQPDGKTLAEDLETYLKDKQEKTLMWSLDGILRYVPIAALHDGKTYLVENYRNTIFTPASINVGLTKSASKDWNALGMGVSKKHGAFPELKGVPLEITAIVRDSKNPKGIMSGVAMLDEKFNEKTMLDGLDEGYKVIHFATHFKYKVEKPEESFLLLGDGSPWELKRIETLKQIFENAELVTLSACDTGLGSVCQEANGRDVEGFAYYAQRLGAQAVIASLWQVDDIGTQVLMPEFYRLRQTGMNKAEAMRQTQLALLSGKLNKENTRITRSEPLATDKDKNEFSLTRYKEDEKKPFAHPYYWSPFVLIGNWR